jgi:predicted DNA-binding helix-hairpin-helix protein
LHQPRVVERRRARFTVKEVVDLTLNFYKRNYIEGLFLSSGVIRTGDYTMEEMVRVAKSLRLDHDFRGYIHLKLIPEASPELAAEAGLYADRVSINVELPQDESLAVLAPEKDAAASRRPWAACGCDRGSRRAGQEGRAPQVRHRPVDPADRRRRRRPDGDILARSAALYGSYSSSGSTTRPSARSPTAALRLPLARPPLMREHRLYQADWLMRFYGFGQGEIVAPGEDLDLTVDPKTAWALRHRGDFPVDVNTADRETLLRTPGLGARGVDRILQARAQTRLTLDDVKRVCGSVKRAKPFIVTADWTPGAAHRRRGPAASLVAPSS